MPKTLIEYTTSSMQNVYLVMDFEAFVDYSEPHTHANRYIPQSYISYFVNFAEVFEDELLTVPYRGYIEDSEIKRMEELTREYLEEGVIDEM